MASKKALLGSFEVKVENRSGFDKSRFNAFTAPLGAIVPMAKQLLLPGHFKLNVKLSAQLPPLAADSFLRSHLKVEAFLVPMRLCYGGFQSWFAGEKVVTSNASPNSATLGKAKLPFIRIKCSDLTDLQQNRMNTIFGVHSLMDYFGVRWPLSSGKPDGSYWPVTANGPIDLDFNIFPFVSYQLCYDHWYRNKMIQRPLFAPISNLQSNMYDAFSLPYISHDVSWAYTLNADSTAQPDDVQLLNGNLFDLRQRNYGFDYFTTALPSAQDGSPMTVSTSGNSFTISSLRLANSLQHFAEVNQVAGPDYIQVCKARYGKAPSAVVAHRPILLGSADFPMYTSGVEQSSQYTGSANGNPMQGMAARYGRAHAEGSDFVCEAEVDEPSYLMVMCSLVPEANYASGISHDMQMFTSDSITDLPNAQLELSGMEPIFARELYMTPSGQYSAVFGYQPRYMWHKAGQQNEVHGLFRKGASLESFIPQRDFDSAGSPPVQISDAFLRVDPSDLDNITAVAGAISQFGVMIDSSIELFVSEPLSEGTLPSLVDPAAEHGQSVYIKRGGISLNT